MEGAQKLVINVATWNAMSYLPRFLDSLRQQTTDAFSITVIDNASSDGLVPWLQAHRPDVMVLRNFRRQSVSRAHNQALALALSRWEGENLEQRYVLVTHPSVAYAPGAIAVMCSYLDEHPEVAACVPKMLRAFSDAFGEDGQPQVEATSVIDSTGLVLGKSRRIRQRGGGEEDRAQYDVPAEIFGGGGLCTMLRVSALQAVRCREEWFDEDFEAGHEDTDLAWRLRRFGFRTMYLPDAVAFRWCQRPLGAKRIASRHDLQPEDRARTVRNVVWMLAKNDEPGHFIAHFPWWIFPAILGGLRGLFSWSACKGNLSSIVGLPRMFAKRKFLKKNVLVKGAAMKKWFK